MPAPRSSSRTLLAVLASAVGAFALLQSLVSPVLPTIQRDLHTTASAVIWVMTAWLLAAAVATPLVGRVGDMAGKDRTLVAALAAIAVGSLIAAVAPSLPVLLAGRVVQGLGGAVFAVSFGILRDELPAARVASAVGILSAAFSVGGGLGMVLAGPIVTAFGWRGLFWIPLAVISLVAVLASRWVPASPARTPGRINWLAALLLGGWLVALLVPLSEASSSWGWGSPGTVGLLVVAVVLFAAWMRVELRSTTRLIDMRMMRIPAVWTTNVLALLFGAVMFGIYAFLPQFVQLPRATGYGLGETVTQAGLLMLPLLVTMAIGGVLAGRLAALLGHRLQLQLASVVSVLGCVSLALFHDSVVPLALAGAVLGLAFGSAYSSMASLIVQSVPASQTGAAGGMNSNIRLIGGALGTAVISSVVTSSTDRSGLPLESGFTAAFWTLAAVSLAATGLALLIPARRAAVATPAPEPAAVAVPVPAGSR